MEKIALNRFGSWISDSWGDCTQAFANVITWGALAFAVGIIGGVLNQCLGLIPYGIGLLFSLIITVGYTAISGMGITGTMLARLHGRDATMDDFKQDLPMLGQVMLVTLITQVVTILAVLIASIPAVGLFFLLYLPSGGGDPNPAIIILSILVGALFMIPTLMAVTTLLMFATPLCLDKKRDFWTAITESVDCTRRDLGGLMIFYLIVNLIASIGVLACCIGTMFTAPLASQMVLRAYREYFGLEPDHLLGGGPSWPPPPPPTQQFEQNFGSALRHDDLNEANFPPPPPPPPPPPAPPRQ